jgi:Domain of Unknown Function with PDB structure (DUF3857)/Transglutaminase-like superfamily
LGLKLRPGRIGIKFVLTLSIVSFLLLFFVHKSGADVVITLLDGSEIVVESIEYQGERLICPDGKAFAREQVKKIVFLKGSRGWRYEPTEPNLKGYRAYLKEGKRLAERYPGFAVYGVEDENLWIKNPDGTSSYEIRVIYYIAKDEGKSYASGSRWFVEERKRLAFLALRSISGDLNVANVEPARIQKAKVDGRHRFFQRGSGVFYQIPQAQVGGLVEIHVREENFNPFDPKIWFPINWFQTRIPIARSSFIVRVPENMKINHVSRHMPDGTEKPLIEKKEGMTEYKWLTGEMPAMIPEPSSPKWDIVTPLVTVSPFFDWDYLFDWGRKTIGDKCEPDKNVRKMALKVVNGAKTDHEKTALIYHFVQKNVRYISIKGSVGSGWGGHPAWMTLQNRFGDCIDKAILLTAMLKTVGIEAEPVVINAGGGLQLMKYIPTMYANHAITRVTINGESFYLDSTGSVNRYPTFGPGGEIAWLEFSKKLEVIPSTPSSMNHITTNFRITFRQDSGMRVKRKTTAVGRLESRLRRRLTGMKEKDRKEGYMKEAAKLSPGGELLGFSDKGVDDLANPVLCKVEWDFPNYIHQSGDLRFFKLPFNDVKFHEISLAQRKYDLDFRAGLSSTKNYEIILPAGYKVATVPDDLDLHDKYFSIIARYEVSGDKLKFTFHFQREACTVPLSDYPEYRKNALKAEKYFQQFIFITQEKGGKK